MSHNDRTIPHATERRSGVRLLAAKSAAIGAGIWLRSEHFANDGQPNLQQPVRKNETTGLITRKEFADGD
jgi:hypothetical protein